MQIPRTHVSFSKFKSPDYDEDILAAEGFQASVPPDRVAPAQKPIYGHGLPLPVRCCPREQWCTLRHGRVGAQMMLDRADGGDRGVCLGERHKRASGPRRLRPRQPEAERPRSGVQYSRVERDALRDVSAAVEASARGNDELA